jgi:hypothetical protein
VSELSSRERREKLEQWLKTELLAAAHNVDEAIPEKKAEVLQRYLKAIALFSRLVLDDGLPTVVAPPTYHSSKEKTRSIECETVMTTESKYRVPPTTAARVAKNGSGEGYWLCADRPESEPPDTGGHDH